MKDNINIIPPIEIKIHGNIGTILTFRIIKSNPNKNIANPIQFHGFVNAGSITSNKALSTTTVTIIKRTINPPAYTPVRLVFAIC